MRTQASPCVWPPVCTAPAWEVEHIGFHPDVLQPHGFDLATADQGHVGHPASAEYLLRCNNGLGTANLVHDFVCGQLYAAVHITEGWVQESFAAHGCIGWQQIQWFTCQSNSNAYVTNTRSYRKIAYGMLAVGRALGKEIEGATRKT